MCGFSSYRDDEEDDSEVRKFPIVKEVCYNTSILIVLNIVVNILFRF